MEKKSPIILLKELSEALGLEFEKQDWGIINADEERFDEFLVYLNNNPDLDNTQKYQLTELIIASFNEKLIEDKITEQDIDKFSNFVTKAEFIDIVEYWENLKDNDEFPVSEVINKILSHPE